MGAYFPSAPGGTTWILLATALVLGIFMTAWLLAAIDTIRTGDMQLAARVSIGVLLLLAPPLGLLLWLILRGIERPGLAMTGLASIVLMLALVVLSTVLQAMAVSR
ncbi:MAG: hypothetical protein QOE92_2435 [Chloroflexota bacterium]|jgi:hypothetical protein|nr:hypothetical protein [Chloroflexota bacterium]